MYLTLISLHVVLCVLLVLIIILQPGKGGDVGAAFGGGGGGSQMFGPRGPTNLLQRATTVVAVLFMVTSMSLAWYSNKSVLSDSNVEDELLRLQEEQRAENKGADTPDAVEEAEPAVDLPEGAPPPEAAPVEDAADGE